MKTDFYQNVSSPLPQVLWNVSICRILEIWTVVFYIVGGIADTATRVFKETGKLHHPVEM